MLTIGSRVRYTNTTITGTIVRTTQPEGWVIIETDKGDRYPVALEALTAR